MTRDDDLKSRPRIGDAAPNDATRSWHQLGHACGMRWEGYLSNDPEKASSEIGEVIRVHVEKTGCKEHGDFARKLAANLANPPTFLFRVIGEGSLEGQQFNPISCTRATQPTYLDVVELTRPDGRPSCFAQVVRVSEMSMVVAVRPLRN